MTEDQLNRLAKIMMMTTSPNDNEALVAARKSNEFIKRLGYDWASLIEELSLVVYEDREEPSRAPKTATSNPINDAFDIVMASDLSPRSRGFVDSLWSWWRTNGWLSKKQREALFEMAEDRGWTRPQAPPE